MSRRPVQDPVTIQKPDDLHDSVTTHPAFGQIAAHRINGRQNLYGSDFPSNGFMRITIQSSELIRSLSSDRHYAKTRMIEVDMTESQWATFISAPNMGMGVPCTIDNFNGELLPHLPDPPSRVEQYAGEAGERLEDGMRQLRELRLLVSSTPGISKKAQAEIESKIRQAENQLGPNIKFVEDQFRKHAEKTVERAKQEIHGHMVHTFMREGANALGTQLPLDVQIGEGKQEDSGLLEMFEAVPVETPAKPKGKIVIKKAGGPK